MLLRIILLLMAIVGGVVCPLYARAEFTVTMPIKDRLNRHGVMVMCTTMEYIEEDSLYRAFGGESKHVNVIRLSFPEKPRPKQYMLYVEAWKMEDGKFVKDTNYDSRFVAVEVPDDAKYSCEMPPVLMELHREQVLEEVSVSASKVMFYHKGDTLVYNASAFVLAEGSMLDAMIRQMPGVELRRNGEIWCNGRKIDNMLLNGRDIFNGKHELMLENLAAYTVKDIAVYEKTGRTGELMGRVIGDEKRVMDVRLKREYSHGGVLNVEGGYGTSARFMAKIFGMWFSDNVSMTAYAGANNLSDVTAPGRDDGSWSRENMGEGVMAGQKAGVTYDAKGYDDRWELKGGVAVDNRTDIVDRSTNVESYLSGGNVYDYSWLHMQSGEFNVSTSHDFFAKLGRSVILSAVPTFKYSVRDNERKSLSASMRDKVIGLSRDRLMAVYSDGDKLVDTLLNRMIDEECASSRELRGGATLSLPVKLRSGSNANMLTFGASADYGARREERFDRFRFNVGADPEPMSAQHRYYRQYPSHDASVSARSEFTQFIDNPLGRVSAGYAFAYNGSRRTSDVYLMDGMPGYDADSWALDHIYAGTDSSRCGLCSGAERWQPV